MDTSTLDKVLNGPPKGFKIAPEPSGIQKLFERINAACFEDRGSTPYFFYAIERFGLLDGLRRCWTYHVSPVHLYHLAKRRYRTAHSKSEAKRLTVQTGKKVEYKAKAGGARG